MAEDAPATQPYFPEEAEPSVGPGPAGVRVRACALAGAVEFDATRREADALRKCLDGVAVDGVVSSSATFADARGAAVRVSATKSSELVAVRVPAAELVLDEDTAAAVARLLEAYLDGA